MKRLNFHLLLIIRLDFTFDFFNVHFLLRFLALFCFLDINWVHNFDVGHFDFFLLNSPFCLFIYEVKIKIEFASVWILNGELKCSSFYNWLRRNEFVNGNLMKNSRVGKITRDSVFLEAFSFFLLMFALSMFPRNFLLAFHLGKYLRLPTLSKREDENARFSPVENLSLREKRK